jgi:hypothetical protein
MPRWKEGTPVAVIKLWEWQHEGATHFRAELYQLIQKADGDNLAKLALGFPDEVDALRRWRLSANEETFFNQYFKPKEPNEG